MRITVLRGGPSSEREVSLVSGKAVADGLRAAGHEVFESDIDPMNLAGLDVPCDVIFPVLHGDFGESGDLQEILESRGLRFVGSGSRASRIGINKPETKRFLFRAGVPVPTSCVTTNPMLRPNLPCVVKPVDGGSSIDVFICRTTDEATAGVTAVIEKYGRALVEDFIEGTEFTVGIFEDRALHPIRINTSRTFYDFKAKYGGHEQTHFFDLQLPQNVVDQMKHLALRAHQAIGCRDLSRVDILVDRQNRPFILEINTMPGFTPTSLLPDMARHEGIKFIELVDRLAKQAFAQQSTARVA